MMWTGDELVLLALDLVDNPGADEPSLYRAVAYSFTSRSWRNLPDAETVGGGWPAWFALVGSPAEAAWSCYLQMAVGATTGSSTFVRVAGLNRFSVLTAPIAPDTDGSEADGGDRLRGPSWPLEEPHVQRHAGEAGGVPRPHPSTEYCATRNCSRPRARTAGRANGTG